MPVRFDRRRRTMGIGSRPGREERRSASRRPRGGLARRAAGATPSAGSASRRARGRLALLPAVLVALGCLAPPARHSPTAPIGGRFEREARRADILGFTPAASATIRPLRIGETAAEIAAADPRREYRPEPWEPQTADAAWLAGLADRRSREIEDATAPGEPEATYLEPLEHARARFTWVDGPVKFQNEQGRRFEEGANLHISSRAVARLANRLVVTVEPELRFNENRAVEDDSTDFGLTFQEAAVSADLSVAEITAGRMPLWWGPGRHGALLVSNNARGLDLVKVSSGGPRLLPGPLAWTGLWRAEAFVSRLEGTRPVARPTLLGARVTTRVNPWLELGLSRIAMLGGEGRAVTGTTIWRAITAGRVGSGEDPREQLGSIDARVILPLSWQPLELYGEYGGADEADGFLEDPAYLAGAHLPRLGPWDGAELTVEVADTSLSGERGAWYGSRSYPSGYTLDENVIGHHVGSDGLDVYLGLVLKPAAGWRVLLSGDYEEHSRLGPVTERLYQFRVALEKEILEDLWVSGFWEHDRWDELGGVRGSQDEGHALGVGVAWRF